MGWSCEWQAKNSSLSSKGGGWVFKVMPHSDIKFSQYKAQKSHTSTSKTHHYITFVLNYKGATHLIITPWIWIQATCFKCEANKESAELFLPHTQITAPRIFLQKSVKFLAAKANFHINASSKRHGFYKHNDVQRPTIAI